MPLETLADKSINHYFQFVKFALLSDESLTKLGLNEKQLATLKTDQRPNPSYIKEVYLDVEGLKAEGLNDGQVELLRADFVERGLLPGAAVEDEPKKGKKK